MRIYQNILCTLHGPEYKLETLHRACALAMTNGARLEIAILHPEFSKDLSAYLADFKSRMLDDISTAIASIASEYGYNGAEFAESVPIDFYSDKPGFISIVRQVMQQSHDLLIKQPLVQDRKRQRGFRSLDMNLLRKCPCPVWLDRTFLNPDAPHIVIAVDPNNEDDNVRNLGIKVLKAGVQIADYLGARCDILGCWDFEYEGYLRNAPFGKKTSHTEVDAMLDETRQEYTQALNDIIDSAGVSREHTNIILQRGDPADIIPQYLKDHACDMLVMGTLARTGIPALFIGNTAEDITQSVRCSTLAIKPDGFKTPVEL